ncbi:Rieske (2Fe-2S) protein [Geobacter pelophilus]|uniref:Rieske (2Fe-2S) protein n=1 Tax=Geoanaerobacter pelophilus TaxID=60036 RepID=A0AAW4KZH4_9BACT|nr:Rieske (2Fe-2S) protein [Geoanaerobacter pelophilus]MBT0663779.1 Rieske (2Fe-2S) protein [Geoanaerobacter pelophilus]
MPLVAKLGDIPNWGKKVVELDGVQILLINVKGEIFACENECPHQGSPLNAGVVKDGPTLSCPRHGYKFNLRSGACNDYPEYVLKTYPIRLEGEDVFLDVG